MPIKIFENKDRLNLKKLILLRQAKDKILRLAENSFSSKERNSWNRVYITIDAIGVKYYEAIPRRKEVGFRDALSSLRKFRGR